MVSGDRIANAKTQNCIVKKCSEVFIWQIYGLCEGCECPQGLLKTQVDGVDAAHWHRIWIEHAKWPGTIIEHLPREAGKLLERDPVVVLPALQNFKRVIYLVGRVAEQLAEEATLNAIWPHWAIDISAGANRVARSPCAR